MAVFLLSGLTLAVSAYCLYLIKKLSSLQDTVLLLEEKDRLLTELDSKRQEYVGYLEKAAQEHYHRTILLHKDIQKVSNMLLAEIKKNQVTK